MNWEKLGLKCGLEIHQQLEGKKLFCECATRIRDDTPSSNIIRRLRMAAGETGEVDVAAAAEIAKGKYFNYESYKDTTCLVELDETPPLPMNKEALFVALQVCKTTNSHLQDCIQVMRKTVVDGSNTSGFQRTALIGRNGTLEVKGKKISIQTIVLEEDAARIISEDAHSTTYRLDRLGIPLIEIATGPDIHTPEEAEKVAKAIGMLLRSTGKAKRGIGTIRQDVNISIAGGTRIEIKGAQELSLIPKLVECEALRQINLINIAKELQQRETNLDAPVTDVTEHLKNSESNVLKAAMKAGGRIMACRLAGFGELLGKEVQPGRRLGTELSDYAKVAAGVKGLFHSDELPKHGITEEEKGRLFTALDCGGNNAFILVAANEEQAVRAIDAAILRAEYAMKGVPAEVRKANPDGSTSFLRPMPGAARMYPETDIQLARIEDKRLQNIPIPESIPDKINKYMSPAYALSKDLAEALAMSNKGKLFEKITKVHKLKPAYIAETLIGAVKTLKRDYNIDANPTDEDYHALFAALSKGQISKESVLDILKECKPVNEIIDKHKMIPEEEVKAILKKIIEDNKNAKFNVLMGLAMKELRGKASGKTISEKLKDLAS